MNYQVILRYQLFCMLLIFFESIYMKIGNKLNPQRSLRKGFGLKGI